MKKNSLIVAILVVMLPGFYIIGCDSAPKDETPQAEMENAMNKAEENAHEAQAEANAELAEFRREMAEQNERYRARIAELKADAARQKADARESYNARIAELEQRSAVLDARIAEYRDEPEPTGKEKWQAFKREFKSDMNDLGSSLENFGRDNKK